MMRERKRDEREDRDVRMELRSGIKAGRDASPGAVEGREMLRLMLADLNALGRIASPSPKGGAVRAESDMTSGSSVERADVEGRNSE
jgi:hypothetical protein